MQDTGLKIHSAIAPLSAKFAAADKDDLELFGHIQARREQVLQDLKREEAALACGTVISKALKA